MMSEGVDTGRIHISQYVDRGTFTDVLKWKAAMGGKTFQKWWANCDCVELSFTL